MDLLASKTYTPEEIKESVLVWYDGPGAHKFNYAPEIRQVFLEGSNFYQLKSPIVDEYGNEFFDSEGRYMSQRTDDLEVKKAIAELSKTFGSARNARVLYKDLLEEDIVKRAAYMKTAVHEKFNVNEELQEILLATGDKNIIEYTYRKDTNFGIDQETLTGKNILGKLLVDYRDNLL